MVAGSRSHHRDALGLPDTAAGEAQIALVVVAVGQARIALAVAEAAMQIVGFAVHGRRDRTLAEEISRGWVRPGADSRMVEAASARVAAQACPWWAASGSSLAEGRSW